jgi:hypothetical protein
MLRALRLQIKATGGGDRQPQRTATMGSRTAAAAAGRKLHQFDLSSGYVDRRALFAYIRFGMMPTIKRSAWV